MGPASEADFGHRSEMSEDTIHHLQGAFTATARPFTARTDSWHPHEDSRADHADGVSPGGFNRGRGIWTGVNQPTHAGNFVQSLPQQPSFMDNRNAAPAWPATTSVQATQPPVPATQRVFSGPSVPTYGFEGRFTDDGPQFNPGGMRRTTSQYNRPSSGYSNRAPTFGSFGPGLQALATAPMTPMAYGGPLGYQPRPIGTPLSPTASEFTASSLSNVGGSAWPMVSCDIPSATILLTIARQTMLVVPLMSLRWSL
jgi:hypothetical protein